jgi:Fur family iron response transcriptional regulator
MASTLLPLPKAQGCPLRSARERLRGLGMRPTHQRVMLAWLLFGTGDRHVSAEQLHEEARRARIPVSLATVYNTLHVFAREGLVREIAGVGQRSWFDTNTGEHAHFLDEDTASWWMPRASLRSAPCPRRRRATKSPAAM